MHSSSSPRSLTELQADLPTNMLGRHLEKVESTLANCFEGNSLMDVIGRRMLENGDGEETIVLDAGCGIGTAIEKIARTAAHIAEDQYMVRGKIRAIGIDLNPRPDLIPIKILSTDGEPTQHRAEFRRDDMRTLATVPDNSVDVLYSVSGLEYVDDCLRALEAGWRVLKEGGVMGFEAPSDLICEPHIQHVIQGTEGASDVFSIREKFRDNDYSCDYRFILGRKNTTARFKGFPYRLVGRKMPYIGPSYTKPHYKHVVVGIYERISAQES